MSTIQCAQLSETLGLRPKGYAPAVALSAYPAGLDGASRKQFQILQPYFVQQKSDCSCSVASTTVVLNAALAQRKRPTVTQQAVLASDPSGHWADVTGDAPNCPGVDLQRLGLYVMRSFYKAGLKHVSVDVNHILALDNSATASFRHQLDLAQQNPAHYFMILNFYQADVLKKGDPVGHMSVAAAYDADADRVLVYDVDNRGFEPYWVTVSTLMRAMATLDDETGEPRGYLIVRLSR